jgi:hypothetical protein
VKRFLKVIERNEFVFTLTGERSANFLWSKPPARLVY